MKKSLFYLLASIALMSCSSSSSPIEVAKKFSENMSMGNLEEASNYVMPSQFKTKLDQFMAYNGGSQTPQYPNYTFRVVKDSIDGEQAWVTYINPKEEEDVLMLVKIDNEWKINPNGEIID